MTRTIRTWAMAATIGVVAAAMAAPTSVSPTQGGCGATVTLTGYGFVPVKKPVVTFVPRAMQEARRKLGAKVTTFSGTQIRVTGPSGVAGVYDVQITPKDRGVAKVTLPDPFTLVVPAPSSVDPTAGEWKAVVTVHGTAFGPTKGKVTIGGKNAAVRSWADKQIRVIVPSRLATGAQPVVVKNKAGASDGALTFDCTGAPPKPNAAGPNDEYIRADLTGLPHFEATNAKLMGFNVAWNPANSQLTFGGPQNPLKGVPGLVISVLPLDVNRAKPFDIGLNFVPPNGSIATLGYTDPTYKLHNASLGVPGSALTVTIDSWDGTFLIGRFNGTLIDLVGGAPPIVVTNGEFKTRRVTGH